MMRLHSDHNRRRRGDRGQTLVIAIMVMFILAMIAAIFIALVARNLFRSERFSNVDAVAQIAEAGIRYADKMLTSGEDGADWRPKPDNMGVTNTPVWPGTAPAPAPNWTDMRDANPDFKWTRAYWPEEVGCAGPTGGYTTYNTGGGRFLLRVSYNPNPSDPYSKYIKIESVGRWGVFDNNDPTTWRPHSDSLLRREITAYKPIGITDYARFVTNRNNRSMEMPLGWPGYSINFGRPESARFGHRGGPIRVNGNLLWYGSNHLYLRGAYPVDENGNPMTSTDKLIPIDAVEVAGEIRLADTDSPTGVTLQRMAPDGTLIDGSPIDLRPSDDSNFTTASGFFRDGSDLTDNSMAARGVKRIDPPTIDQADPTNTTTRYRLLTLNSGERIQSGGGWANLGSYGWGRGVYISNTRDKQDESETLTGGYTLRSDWLKPNNPMSTYWKGPYYVPPAAVITLHPADTDGDGQPDFSITRTDTDNRGRKWVWRDAWGRSRQEWGQTVTMPYPDAKNGRTIYRRNADGTWNLSESRVLRGNGVIFAEGNIRIRGMLPPDTQLTVVSNANIYIDGNLLKYRDPSQTISNTNPWRATDGTNTCGLALLARENVCVNTTQFFSPLNSISADDVGSDAQSGQPPFHVIVSDTPDSQLKCRFEFGPWESESAASPPTSWMLYLRHAGQFGTSYINAWLNPSSNLADWGILYLNPDPLNTGLPIYVWGVGDPRFNNAPGWGIRSTFACDAFPLTAALNANLRTAPGLTDILQIGLDQTSFTRSNYLMGGLAVQPMDIRIEAVIYAQEGSFYVLPGNWFNPNPADAAPASRIGAPRGNGIHPKFPFYGDALDVRIIIDGAVSENIPAPISDVQEWMHKWGRIPERYGSSNELTAHPGEGLAILYDDHCGWPYSDLRDNTPPRNPIRADKYGRPLPIAPRLPVCGSLIYFGDVM